jgi:hypothetical protein
VDDEDVGDGAETGGGDGGGARRTRGARETLNNLKKSKESYLTLENIENLQK